MSTSDNPSAFPYPGERDADGCGIYAGSFGMTLRDYFAAKCAAAIVGSLRSDDDYWRLRHIAAEKGMNVSGWIAAEAGKQADAMLAERARTLSTKPAWQPHMTDTLDEDLPF